MRFDWPKLEAAIREDLDHLPDLYTYKKERVEDRFRAGLLAFAKELIAKARYWSDHDTRPDIRAVLHEVQALNRKGEYAEALVLWANSHEDGPMPAAPDSGRGLIGR